MEKGFLDKVKDNATVRIWFEKTQQEKGDSLTEGYMSELWDFTSIKMTQNNLQELKEVWDQRDDETKQLFYFNYGDLPYLLDVKVDKNLFRALTQYWNLAYSCFTFGKVDLVPTSLQDEDIEWRAPWMIPDEILYQYRDFDWVPLLRIWGTIGCTPLLVLR
ncbi:hypothetical protein Gohar_008699 [Gossypium harknessii]|uniref:DUF7745 domain-containing protein n=1 Tax=Gossypium harknessii TaxID=34285 RepID=A0A7J9GLU3_9ROSI|nr:hypothetical protein [Gossypium harknessii]